MEGSSQSAEILKCQAPFITPLGVWAETSKDRR